MYKKILPFLKITYGKKYKCIHSRQKKQPQSTKLLVVYFFYPKYLDLYSLSKIFLRNDSFLSFEGLVS